MRILEANVDDIGLGGVYSLIRNVILNKKTGDVIDIAAYEHFENKKNVEELESKGASVCYIGYEGNKIIKQFRIYKNMKVLVREGRYDCVHIHSDIANKLLVLGLASKMGGAKRIVMHSHASSVDGSHRYLKKIFHYVSRIFLPMIATDFMSCSNLATSWMFPQVTKNNVTILNNGVDLLKFKFSEDIRKRVREELNIKREMLLVGHVGRFAYQKNHEYLLRIFAKLKEIRKDACILLIGIGELQDAMKSLACELGIIDSVIFYGASPRVCDLLQAMDVFVLPSHFEGLPIVGVEAQASGLPVIFSEEISRDSKIIENVSFLPIGTNNIKMWVDEIIRISAKSRQDTYDIMNSSGFSLNSTIRSLMAFYHNK